VANPEPPGHTLEVKARHDTVALVTGATRGIGEAIARRLASEGALVGIAGRDAARREELCAELEAAGRSVFPVELDVGDPDSIARAVEVVGARAPEGLDWLVNNAGIAESAPLDATSEELYAKHMRVNFEGPRRLVGAFLPAMLEGEKGAIVNVASSAGLRGYAYVAAYCASKFALVGWTLAAALELERTGVSINAVCPHYVDSPMLERSIEHLRARTGRPVAELRAWFRDQNPGGELVTMDQVADGVWRALTEEKNGMLLELDGGEARWLSPNQAPGPRPQRPKLRTPPSPLVVEKGIDVPGAGEVAP